jgi:hypothetical protein
MLDALAFWLWADVEMEKPGAMSGLNSGNEIRMREAMSFFPTARRVLPSV